MKYQREFRIDSFPPSDGPLHLDMFAHIYFTKADIYPRIGYRRNGRNELQVFDFLQFEPPSEFQLKQFAKYLNDAHTGSDRFTA